MKKDDSIELQLEPLPPKLKQALLSALRGSGMRDAVCPRCTRPHLTRREDSSLCVPCERGKPDGWTPAHTMRALATGTCRPREGWASCAQCAGLGSVGWEPFAPSPPCPACGGLGQQAESV